MGTTYRSIIYSSDVSASELTQIQKYGGYYVGRYESGLDKNITVASGTKTNGTENEPYDVSEIPRIQAGIEPWDFISYTKSKENAENIYSTSTSVNSGLLTGTMWDTMMYFMGDNSYTSSKLTSSTWGNYADTTPTITLGRYAKAYYSSESCKLKNIYDVAGNLQEWTEETAITDNTANTVLSTHRVNRGGSVIFSYSVNPACYRENATVSYSSFDVGFRIALYIK